MPFQVNVAHWLQKKQLSWSHEQRWLILNEISSMRSCTSCTTAIEMNGNSNGLFSPGITVYTLHFVSSKWTSSVHQFFISICQSLSPTAYILPEEGLCSQRKQWGILMGWAGTFQMSAQAFFNFLTKLKSFEVWTWARFGWLKVKIQCWICAGRKMQWEIDFQTRIIISTAYTRKEKGSGEGKKYSVFMCAYTAEWCSGGTRNPLLLPVHLEKKQ